MLNANPDKSMPADAVPVPAQAVTGPHPAPRKLTGHLVNECNDKIVIQVVDDPGHGGASHHYRCTCPGFDEVWINFQNGPIKECGTNGITHEVLLAILIDRLQCFQNGQYNSLENAIALTHLEEAQMWLQ